MKILVLLVFFLFPSIFRLGDYLLSWLTFSENAQVIFVVAVFPSIMTSLQFALIDAIIKGKWADGEGAHEETDEDRQRLLFEEAPLPPTSPSRRRGEYAPGAFLASFMSRPDG